MTKEVAIDLPADASAAAGHVEVQGGHETAFRVDGDATWRSR